MDQSSQLIFDFSNFITDEKFKESDFIFSKENEAAVKFLEKFFLQNNQSQNRVQSAILKGDQASGKSHLLHIFAKKYNAFFLIKNDQKNPNFFIENNFYILEDFDKNTDEETLLHLINSASEAKSFLLLTTKNIPNFSLADLNSRIKNIIVTQIKNPDSAMLRMLLINGLARRQLKLNNDSINFITLNLKRDYRKIIDILDKIETFCHQNKKSLSLIDVKKLLS